TEGYKGRVGIYEVKPNTPKIDEIIMRARKSIEIAEVAAKQGVNNIRKSGLKKGAKRVTTLVEDNRVTNV
ncbi:type IV-A pilus assembly ATPase PilB, partial [Pseudoalteromonas ruthenica]